jgi:hypothetical protein
MELERVQAKVAGLDLVLQFEGHYKRHAVEEEPDLDGTSDCKRTKLIISAGL